MNNKRQKLPEGWAITSMGEVSEVIGGGTPSSKVSANFDEKSGYPWITPADLGKFTDIYIKRGRRFLTEKGLISCSARLVPAGSVLLSSRAPIGYVAIAANELCTNQGFKSFVCHQGLESEFIYYWLLYKRQELQQMGSGSTFAELSGAKAKQIPLAISPTREQTIISEVLKKLFARANITKVHLDNVAESIKRFRKCVLNSACTGKLTEDWREKHSKYEPWKQVDFFDFCILQRGYDLPIKKCKPGPYPVVSSGGIVAHHSEFKAKGPGVTVGRSGSTGKVHYVDEDFWPHNTSLFVKDFKGNLPKYVYYFLLGFSFQRFSASTAVPTLNRNTLRGVKVKVPPVDEQVEIVRQVERLFDLSNSIERRVKTATEKTEKLTQSILSKAFRGELVPTEAELARIEGRDYETAKELLGRVAKAKAAEANDKEKKQMKRQLSVKHKKQLVRHPLLEVIRKNPEGITPENLLRMANYTIEEIDDFYCDLSNIMQEIEEIKPSGSQAKKWPTKTKILIKPMKV